MTAKKKPVVCKTKLKDAEIKRLKNEVIELEASPPFQALAEKLAKEKEALIKAGDEMRKVFLAHCYTDEYSDCLIKWAKAKRSCK